MLHLLIVSLVWAFSFGLIGNRLAGIDSSFVAAARLAIALACFLPFLRWRRLPWGDALALTALGSLQFGVMYVAYIRAFAYLPSHLVALFTVLTPVYVVVASDLLEGRFHPRFALCAGLSVAGAAVIRSTAPGTGFWWGFGLVQVANVAFGVGQVWYRRWRLGHPERPDHQVFALPCLGGAILAGLSFLVLADGRIPTVSRSQWMVLLYLGAVASGLGFFLWNRGATRVSPGTLAAFNNAVVPLAILVSLFLFGEAAGLEGRGLLRVVAGGGLILAGILIGRSPRGRGARVGDDGPLPAG